jgi:hypothetical protein
MRDEGGMTIWAWAAIAAMWIVCGTAFHFFGMYALIALTSAAIAFPFGLGITDLFSLFSRNFHSFDGNKPLGLPDRIVYGIALLGLYSFLAYCGATLHTDSLKPLGMPGVVTAIIAVTIGSSVGRFSRSW